MIKIVKNYLRFFILDRKINSFLNADINKLKSINYTKEKLKSPLHIITITFNNEILLQKQIDLITKNIVDDFIFIVADNSSNSIKRRLISKICCQNKVIYIPLPANPYSSSQSHAASINFIYNKHIKIQKPSYFGFIDHDIFPIKIHSIINILKTQNVYGHKQERGDYWYLWAGLCFFNYEKINNNLDFSTTIINDIWLDTGGANFMKLYKNLKKDKILFPSHQYINIREGDSIQSQKIEIIGEWLHSFNGSYWLEMAPKEQILMNYLNKNY